MSHVCKAEMKEEKVYHELASSLCVVALFAAFHYILPPGGWSEDNKVCLFPGQS